MYPRVLFRPQHFMGFHKYFLNTTADNSTIHGDLECWVPLVEIEILITSILFLFTLFLNQTNLVEGLSRRFKRRVLPITGNSMANNTITTTEVVALEHQNPVFRTDPQREESIAANEDLEDNENIEAVQSISNDDLEQENNNQQRPIASNMSYDKSYVADFKLLSLCVLACLIVGVAIMSHLDFNSVLRRVLIGIPYRLACLAPWVFIFKNKNVKAKFMRSINRLKGSASN